MLHPSHLYIINVTESYKYLGGINFNMKQVILVRQDLKMDKGKCAVQCAHAAVDGILLSSKKEIRLWKEDGMKKVVLKVKDVRELMKYKREAQKRGLVTAVIKDAARTFFKRPTVTCVSIGPDDENKIDSVTKDLKML